MSTLLYITVNSKPEDKSASKRVGRAFVNEFLKKNSEFELEEIDLYEGDIPRLKYQYFENRNCVFKSGSMAQLDEQEQVEIKRILQLAEQFRKADVYVIAAPMWSLSFPAPLKEYIDCVMQDGVTVTISEEKVEGLLEDKQRAMIYIQSSGGSIPWLMGVALNKGIHYMESMAKFMGIKRFEQLLVDGTGFSQEEKEKAIEKALIKVPDAVEGLWKRK